jgi:hypothetical protein
MTWSLNLMLEERQISHMCAAGWPYMPSTTQVFSVYISEVLGHAPEAPK